MLARLSCEQHSWGATNRLGQSVQLISPFAKVSVAAPAVTGPQRRRRRAGNRAPQKLVGRPNARRVATDCRAS